MKQTNLYPTYPGNHGFSSLLFICCGLLAWVFPLQYLWAENIEQLKAGVVKIVSEADGVTQTGTGIIIHIDDEAAYILTASHVTEGSPTPNVYFYSQPHHSFSAQLIGQEGGNPKGLAAWMIKGPLPPDIHPLPLDSSITITGGETVTLIGFPLLAGTPWAVSKGTVAGPKGTDLTFSGPADSGNSGGPLLIDGKVVGIITQKTGEFGFASPTIFAEYALNTWGIKLAKPDSSVIPGQTTTSTPTLPNLPEQKDDPFGIADNPTPADTNPFFRSAPSDSPSSSDLAGMPADSSYETGVQALLTGNFSLAQEYLSQAAEAGNTNAMFLVGYMLIDGSGGVFNPEKGLTLWQEAAAQGHPQAQLALQQLYAQNLGTLGYQAPNFDPLGNFSQQAPLLQELRKKQNQQDRALKEIQEQYNSRAKQIIESLGR